MLRNRDLLQGFSRESLLRIVAALDLPERSPGRSPNAPEGVPRDSSHSYPLGDRDAHFRLRLALEGIAQEHVRRSRLQGYSRSRCAEEQKLARLAQKADEMCKAVVEAKSTGASSAEVGDGLADLGLSDDVDSPYRVLEFVARTTRVVSLTARNEHIERCAACADVARSNTLLTTTAPRRGRPPNDTLEQTVASLAVVYESITERPAKINRDATQVRGEELLRPGFGRFAWRFFRELQARFPDCAAPSASSLEQTHHKNRRAAPRK